MSRSSTPELNAVAREAARILTEYLRGRRMPDRLYGALYLAVEDHLRNRQEPALRPEHKNLIDIWARQWTR